jgi:hypothetical protein
VRLAVAGVAVHESEWKFVSFRHHVGLMTEADEFSIYNGSIHEYGL